MRIACVGNSQRHDVMASCCLCSEHQEVELQNFNLFCIVTFSILGLKFLKLDCT